MSGLRLESADIRSLTPVAHLPHVRGAGREDEEAWDRFVLDHAHGSPFHLIAWRKTIEETFGFRPMYRVAMNDEGICGILPLFLVDNLLTGKVLLSSPFAVYGGILANSAAALTALREDVAALGRDLGVQHVELRNSHEEQCVGFERLPRYVTFTQAIAGDEEALLRTIPRKTRYMVRKALKEEYVCTRQSGASNVFLDLYLSNLRRLGTPAFPRKLFDRIFRNFGNMVDVREYAVNGKPAAAVLTFYFRGQVMPYYGASDPAMNAHSPNNFMYFDLMRWGSQNGYSVFDFGRSKKEVGGSYEFKAHWGMLERDLPYEVLLVKRKELPNFSPANSKFSALTQLWSRLPPGMTRVLGPMFVRLFP